MAHELDPLLRPRSIAVVGASKRKHSMGQWSLENLRRGGFEGAVYPLNPGHEEIDGLKCYGTFAELPEIPDLAIFAVGDQRIEQALDAAIDKGVRAAVIMSSLCIDDDVEPALKERVRQKVTAANLLVCGANGMGFYNFRDNTWCCGFDSRHHDPGGNASLISQSGAGMSGIIDCEERLHLNFAVSTGIELTVSADRYLDFVLDLPETRVVGLFLETARNPAGFRAALAKARDKGIPIVALKVGRTEKSAALAVSHSGAMAGDDATYEALFDSYGVHRVNDMDELATSMILFAALHPIGPGGLATLHDSGGERQLIVDLADAAGVPLPTLGDETVKRLETVLPPELPAINPLDAWSRGGENAGDAMTDCLAFLMQDPGVAIGGLVHDRGPGGTIYESYVGYLEAASERSGKPVALVAARQGTGSDPLVVGLTRRGYPVLDGVAQFLQGVRGLMNYRDFLELPPPSPPAADEAIVKRWRERLARNGHPDEATSLSMLADFSVPAARASLASSLESLIAAADTMQFPLALKTAMPGIYHKTDRGGVVLDIENRDALAEAYRELSATLGPVVVVAEMAPSGVEMILGARMDPQFGPVVLLGFGGVHAEMLSDVAFALPPFDETHARRCLDRLRLRPLLDGWRGAPPAAVDEFCMAAARFSVMVAELADSLAEIDVNPVIVSETRSIAVDALVVGAKEEPPHDR